MISVIIPAYNEEAVIRRALDGMLAGSSAGDLDIIVCCNGCVDRTAEIARSYGPPVRVLETSTGSKALALNMGDEAALSFPRVYLDADIVLDLATLKSIERALAEPGVLAVAPRIKIDLADRNWMVRGYYNIWLRTPYHQQGMIGSGLYALSEAGRKRFKEFPHFIADDGFVRAQFAPHERKILDDCSFTIKPPATLSALIKIKSRAALGKKELQLKQPELLERLASEEKAAGIRFDYWSIVKNPGLWAPFGVYACVKSIANYRAKQQLRKLHSYQWERDDTTRT